MARKSSILTVKVVGDAKKFNNTMDSVSSKIGSFAGRTAKFALGAAAAFGAIGVAIAGVAIKGGIERALAIENAQAKLAGLGHSTQAVTAVMDSALASVKGTAYGLGDAAGVAATTVAAGVKPGQELTRTLKLVADAATIAQAPMGEMGSIFNKVAAGGNVTTEVLNQLQDRGIPATQLLAKAMGKTVPEVQKLVSTGKVGFAEFQTAMEMGLGGAALKSGNTTAGAFANMQAAMGRWGESLISGVFPLAKTAFGQITGLFDDLSTKSKPAIEQLSNGLAKVAGPAIQQFAAFAQDVLLPAIVTLFTWVGEKLGPALMSFGQSVGGPIIQAFAGMGGAASGLLPWFGTLLPEAIRLLGSVIGAVVSVLAEFSSWVSQNISWLGTLGAAILGGVVAWKAMTVAMTAWQALSAGIATAQAAITAGMAAYRAGLSVATAVQIGFNTAMSANPIGLVVIAVAALAAGIIWVATQTTFFQDAWAALCNFMAPAIDAVVTAITASFRWLSDAWGNVTRWIGDAWGNVTRSISDAWNGMWRWVGNIARTYITGVIVIFRWISDAWGNITRWISDAWSNVWRGAQSIVSGVINWIVGGFNNIVNAVRRVIDWVRALFSGFQVPGWLRDVMSFMGVGATGSDHTTGLPLAPVAGGGTGFFLSAPSRTGGGGAAPQITNVNVTINAGVGSDPVAIGEEINRVLEKWRRATGRVMPA